MMRDILNKEERKESFLKWKTSRKLLFGLTASLLFTSGCSLNEKTNSNIQNKQIESSINNDKSSKKEKVTQETITDNSEVNTVNNIEVKTMSSSKKNTKSKKKKVPKIRNYHGYSIVNALDYIGYDSSFKSRSKLAKRYGIKNYRGTAKQNMKLLRKLKKDNFTGKKKSTIKRPASLKKVRLKSIEYVNPKKPITSPVPSHPIEPERTWVPITPAPVKTVEPTGTPAPVKTAKPTGTPASVETAKPTGTPASVETAKPTGTPASVETAKPTGTPASVETAKPTGTPASVETAKPTGIPEPSPSPEVTETPEPSPSPEVTETPEPCKHEIYDEIIQTAGDDEYCYHLSYDCNLCGETISMDSEANKHSYVEYDNRPYDWYKECSKCFYTIDLPQDTLANITLNSIMMANSDYRVDSITNDPFVSGLGKSVKTYAKRK